MIGETRFYFAQSIFFIINLISLNAPVDREKLTYLYAYFNGVRHLQLIDKISCRILIRYPDRHISLINNFSREFRRN